MWDKTNRIKMEIAESTIIVKRFQHPFFSNLQIKQTENQ